MTNPRWVSGAETEEHVSSSRLVGVVGAAGDGEARGRAEKKEGGAPPKWDAPPFAGLGARTSLSCTTDDHLLPRELLNISGENFRWYRRSGDACGASGGGLTLGIAPRVLGEMQQVLADETQRQTVSATPPPHGDGGLKECSPPLVRALQPKGAASKTLGDAGQRIGIGNVQQGQSVRGPLSPEAAHQRTASELDSAARPPPAHFLPESSREPGTAPPKISPVVKSNAKENAAADHEKAKLSFVSPARSLVATPASTSSRTYSNRHLPPPAPHPRCAWLTRAWPDAPLSLTAPLLHFRQFAGGRRRRRAAADVFRVPPPPRAPPQTPSSSHSGPLLYSPGRFLRRPNL